MIELFKRLYEPIRKGNEYRAEKYGPSNWLPSLLVKDEDARFGYSLTSPTGIESAVGRKVFMSHKDIVQEKADLARFEYLMNWTSARFVKDYNHDFDPRIGDAGTIGYFDINAGRYVAWEARMDA